MKVLVVYDSMFGNTGRIAESIGEGAGRKAEVRIIQAVQSGSLELVDFNLLFVGSPTHGGRPTEAVQNFMDSIPENAMDNIYVAAFDTRFSYKDQNFGLRVLMKAIGYAAEKELKKLVGRGGKPAAPAEGFIVLGKEGPLREGEAERAADWAEHIVDTIVSKGKGVKREMPA